MEKGRPLPLFRMPVLFPYGTDEFFQTADGHISAGQAGRENQPPLPW